MIKVTALCKYYGGKPAVDHVSFFVEQGQTLVLLGTSGSGKTTTLKMINRLIEADEGQVLINGKDIRQHRPEFIRRQIGYVIQNVGLFPHYTVWQNIGLVPGLLKWPTARIEQRNRELLALVGLPEEVARRFPHELSGGQQQRVGLARALAADPPLILMDEPFGALDPITKRQIQAEFDQLDTLRQKTVVLVTHDVFEAVILGDKIALMDQGRLQQLGTPKELLFTPANSFVRSFFDIQRFRLELQVVQLKDILDSVSRITTFHDRIWEVAECSSLLDVLEDMEKEDAAYVRPLDVQKKARPWWVSREDILNGFYAFKEKMKK